MNIRAIGTHRPVVQGPRGWSKDWVLALAAPVLGVAMRVPVFLSSINVGYDDGVHAASVGLMRRGLAPFVDFFSSQGPLFLPLLRAGDYLAFGDLRGPRVTMLLTGGLLAAAAYLLARRSPSPVRSAAVSLLVATSGSLVAAAGPIQSDGLALGVAMVALWCATGPGKAKWAVMAGLLMGVAVAIKSLHVVPVALSIAAVYLAGSRWKDFALAVAAGSGLILVVSLPFGLADVWDQYVLFHLAKESTSTFSGNALSVGEFLLRYDLPITVGLALGAMAVWAGRHHGRVSPAFPTWILWLWLGASVAMVVFFTDLDQGFVRNVGFIAAPLAVLVSTLPVPRTALLLLAVASLPYQLFAAPFIETRTPSEEQAAVIADLGRIPEESYVVSDHSGVVWFGSRTTHPDTVDSSFFRVQTGSLTREGIESALADPSTCGFLEFSGRYDVLQLELPEDYDRELASGLVLRRGC